MGATSLLTKISIFKTAQKENVSGCRYALEFVTANPLGCCIKLHTSITAKLLEVHLSKLCGVTRQSAASTPHSSNFYKHKNRFYSKKCSLKSGLPPGRTLSPRSPLVTLLPKLTALILSSFTNLRFHEQVAPIVRIVVEVVE